MSQLQQVALNYITRRSLWLIAAFGAICVGPGALVGIRSSKAAPQSQPFILFAVGFGVGIVCWVMATQAKWQFCDSRARLVPEFAAPHLAVLVALGLLGLDVYSFLVAVASLLNPLGIAACGIGVGASYLWSIHRPNGVVTAIALIQFFSLMFPATLAFWLSDRFAPFHAVILIAGWIAFAAWIARLVAMREEDVDYNLPIQAQQGSASRMERAGANRNVNRVLLRSAWQRFSCDAWHDRLARFRASTSRARQGLLDYGFTAAPNWASSVPMALMFLAMFWAMNKFGTLKTRGPNESMLPTMNIIFLMPAIFAGQFLAMRRARMPQELQLPLTRSQYFDGVLASVAKSSLLSWMLMLAVALKLIHLTSPEMLTFSFVAGLAAVTGATQVLCFGILIRLAQIESGGKRFAMTMVVIMLAAVPLQTGMFLLGHPGVSRDQLETTFRQDRAEFSKGAAEPPKEVRDVIEANIRDNVEAAFNRMQPSNLVWIAAVACLTAAIGAALTIHGRNRWLTLELG